MTVRVKPTSIEFVSESGNTFTLTETSEGFTFDGVINAAIVSSLGFNSSGYTAGGQSLPGPAYTQYSIIDKFPFATDANAFQIGNLTLSRSDATGQSSSVSGYTSGGLSPSGPVYNVIDKFPFATNASATDVGDLPETRYTAAGQSSSVSGYTSGGWAPGFPISYKTGNIDKFPFASNANATNVGNLTTARTSAAGQSSSVSGYTSGGHGSPPISPYLTIIDKFPFATDASATNVGSLTGMRAQTAGQSSTDNGYTSGGPSSNVIDKFSFASDASATDVGDLTVARGSVAGHSSSVSGYTSGGWSTTNIIDKFPFASNANATDVGDLTVTRSGVSGNQYNQPSTY